MSIRVSTRSSQRGFSLIEAAFATVIAITVAAAAVAGIRVARDRANTRVLDAERLFVTDGAQKYFRAQCHAGALPTSVSVATLIAQGYLSRQPKNVWGASWAVAYSGAAPRSTQVSATLTATLAQASEIGVELKATTVSATTLTWQTSFRLRRPRVMRTRCCSNPCTRIQRARTGDRHAPGDRWLDSGCQTH